jgi:hypothetical protein
LEICEGIEYLELKGNEDLTVNEINDKHIQKYCESINTKGIKKIVLTPLNEQDEKKEKISIFYMNKILNTFGSFPSLESLKFNFSGINLNNLNNFLSLNNIRIKYLNFANFERNKFQGDIKQFINLEKLKINITNSNFKDFLITFSSIFPKIKFLHIVKDEEKIKLIDSEKTSKTSEQLNKIEKKEKEEGLIVIENLLPNLRSIGIKFPYINLFVELKTLIFEINADNCEIDFIIELIDNIYAKLEYLELSFDLSLINIRQFDTLMKNIKKSQNLKVLKLNLELVDDFIEIFNNSLPMGSFLEEISLKHNYYLNLEKLFEQRNIKKIDFELINEERSIDSIFSKEEKSEIEKQKNIFISQYNKYIIGGSLKEISLKGYNF